MRKRPGYTGTSYLAREIAGIRGSRRFRTPSSPDNWRGGTGNWSNGADWTAGLPAGSGDVTINTGTDTVVLDTSEHQLVDPRRSDEPGRSDWG